MRRDLLVSLALFVVTLLVFVQVSHFDFINTDDPQYIRDNAHVRAGLSAASVTWAFQTLKMANWHPLAWLSHMADVEMFGMNAGGHHMTSAVIHAINAALVYFVLVSLTRSPGKSAIVAALFALHPLRMESVAWVAERKDVLCAMFFLIAIGCYAGYARAEERRGRAGWYAGTVVAFVLGAMSKPMIVTLPFVLLLVDCWPLKRPARWGLIVEKVPLFLLALASAVVTVIAQHAGGAVQTTRHLPLALRIGNAIWSYGRYIGKTVWPNDLAAYYPYLGMVPGTSLPWGLVAISLIVLISITAVAIWMWRRGERAVVVGWLWFLGVMVPTIGLVQVGTQAMADRYTYLPHIGLFIAIVWGIDAVVGRARVAATVIAGVILAILAGTTMYQLQYWRNSGTLFDHALRVTDHNSVANMCVGMWLAEQDRGNDALPYFARAVQIDPGNGEAHMNLGNLLSERGQASDAIAHLAEAERIQPKSAEVQNNFANALAAAGRTDEALQHYQTAIALDPDLAQAYFNYGWTLAEKGSIHESLPLFARAVQLQPEYAKAHYGYGLALAAEGDTAGALAHLRRALELHPDWPEARSRLAWLQSHGASSRPATAP